MIRRAVVALAALAACDRWSSPQPAWEASARSAKVMHDGSVAIEQDMGLVLVARNGLGLTEGGEGQEAIGADIEANLVAWDPERHLLQTYGTARSSKPFHGTLVAGDVSPTGAIALLFDIAPDMQELDFDTGFVRFQSPVRLEQVWFGSDTVVRAYSPALAETFVFGASGSYSTLPGDPLDVWDGSGGGLRIHDGTVERVDLGRTVLWTIGLDAEDFTFTSSGDLLGGHTEAEQTRDLRSVTRRDKNGMFRRHTAVAAGTVIGGDADGFYTWDGETVARYDDTLDQ